MQSIQENRIVELILKHKRQLSFPRGLRAFSSVKDFTLRANEGESPLFWLEATKFSNLAFIMVDPYVVLPEYDPQLTKDDFEMLGITSLDECLILCFANPRNYTFQGVTVNLASPIVINWKTGKAKQVILQNQQDYPIDHPASQRESFAELG